MTDLATIRLDAIEELRGIIHAALPLLLGASVATHSTNPNTSQALRLIHDRLQETYEGTAP